MDRFQELLWDLGKEINVPLHIDKNNACKIMIAERLPIQLEMMNHDQLLVVTWIVELPPGRFREDVLKDALKANSHYQSTGHFAYIEKNNMLALYDLLDTNRITGESLATFLECFYQEAESWQAAITNGTTAPAHHTNPPLTPPNPFLPK